MMIGAVFLLGKSGMKIALIRIAKINAVNMIKQAFVAV